jgi:carbamoyltransferase
MVVLGLSLNHDASVCVIIDGKIVSAISRERLCRQKKARFIREYTIKYVLDEAGITIDDVDYVALSYWFRNIEDWATDGEKFKLYVDKKNSWIFSNCHHQDGQISWVGESPNFIEGKGYDIQQDIISLVDPLTIRPFDSVPIKMDLFGKTIEGWFISHHHAHAASSFYTTNFEKAAVLTMDATDANPNFCSLACYGFGNKLETLYYPGLQIGHAYNLFTELLGIGDGIYKAGSTMGLAAFGKVNPDIIKSLDKYTKTFWERTEKIDDWRWIYQLFMKTTGKMIWNYNPESPLVYEDKFKVEFFNKDTSYSRETMDAAATIQYIFEQTVFRALNKLHDDTQGFNNDTICLAGGSFLNCTTNGKIHKNTPFKNVSPYPGSGDEGLSIGAALFVTHHILDIPRKFKTVPEVVYTGKEYETPVGGSPINLEYVAKSLNEGKVVAWFQGGSEFGPRALGNRSFLANPKLPEMKDYLNFQIKNREWYRPFAPAVCYEDVSKYFDIAGESPYMLKICNVITDKLPSVTHVDGTARVQTVKKEDNPKFYEILREFEKFSGVPVLLNTSLNLSDEPIVETPEDALNLFNRSKTDILVINDSMWIK